MPTILRIGSYRFFFYAGDYNEPPHVHVESGNNVAKFWLNPIRFQSSYGFNGREINQIKDIIKENREMLLRSWNEYFSK